jgi:UDP-N-acetylmuramyl pentapeptide phosphotransferase/UDP-N-acetylglucosamine-1-phosphate transferase
MTLFIALAIALAVSALISVLIVVTRRFHGRFTYDSHIGVQKLHRCPTPRVGSLAILGGAIAGGAVLAGQAQADLWYLLAAAVPAMVVGFLEDVTKRVGVKMRLVATFVSGLLFCLLSGYYIHRVDIPGADLLLSVPLFAVLFTTFAVAGIAHAINIIDGVNGLSAGTALVILGGFAMVASQTGDGAMLGVCVVMAGAIGGFFLLNFPAGRLFMGDAGAYLIGLTLAGIAVALPLRNAELSPLIGLLALAYPVVETLISALRRTLRADTSPSQADRLHLHSLFYRSRARQLANYLGEPRLRAPLTSMAMWLLVMLSVWLMVLGAKSSGLILVGLALVAMVYLAIYRRVALLRPRDTRERQTA